MESHLMATPSEVSQRIKQNVERIEERIRAACLAAGRKREEITVVAITKYVDIATTRLLAELHHGPLGESRPQTIWEKQPSLPEAAWHLVGHLQRNKVARTLPLVQLIHSVDSERLLNAIEMEAAKTNRVQEVLLELHLTHETSKSGFAEDEWERLPEYAATLKHMKITGLMGMAAMEGTVDDARATFARLRDLRDRWSSSFSQPHQLMHLSMGMTHDFEQAVLEGATLLRIGSAFFEGVAEGR